jgi:hypothetical protein
MMGESTRAWIDRTKERHSRCLNWKSAGSIALGLTTPVPETVPLFVRYTNPEAMLEHQGKIVENTERIGSDLMPFMHPCFNAAVLFSILGGTYELDEQNIHYFPLLNSWVFDPTLPVPPIDSGLFEDVVAAMSHLVRHAPPHVHVTTPYLHTPLNTAALLRDPATFYLDILEQPQEIHRVLATVTDVLIQSQKLLLERMGRRMTPAVSQEGIYLEDMVKFSDDCCVNMGPEHNEEFNLAYTKRIADEFGVGIGTHYCVLPEKGQLFEHCIEPHCKASHIRSLSNQYPPEYFLEHYERFEGRLSLISQNDSMDRFGSTPRQRAAGFKAWAEDFCERFAGKSGLIILWSVPTASEAEELFGIWESINQWAVGMNAQS